MKSTPLTFQRLSVLLLFVIIACSADPDLDLYADNPDQNQAVQREEQNSEGEALVERTVEFHAISDAYIEGTEGYNLDIVRLEELERTSYLLYDLSEIDGEILRATLEFTIYKDEGSGTIAVHGTDTNRWSDAELTPNNAPLPEMSLASYFGQYRLNKRVSIALNASMIAPKINTLILEQMEGNDLAFASRENTNVAGPKLIITYSTNPNSPLPNTGEDAPVFTNNSGTSADSGNTGSGGDDSTSGDTTSNDDTASDSTGDDGTTSGDSSGGTSDNTSSGDGSTGDGTSGDTGSDSGTSDDTSSNDGTSGTDSSDGSSGSDSSDGSSGSDSTDGTSGSDATDGTSGSGDSGGSSASYPEPDYYVTVNGSYQNDGRSEATAWSIGHAFRNASAGDVVYVKAGDYGAHLLDADNSGDSSNPIRFIGYQFTPGDINGSDSRSFTEWDTPDSSKMPLIRKDPGGGSVGIEILESNVHIENFQIVGYNKALFIRGENVQVKNVAIFNTGDQNASGTYDGIGIRMEGENSSISNSYVRNATAEGIVLKNCTGCTVTNSEVTSDNNINPTDYYILMIDGTTNSTISNSLVRRESLLSHFGHGLVAKANASYNRIINCQAYNTNLELSFEDVHDNLVKDILIRGTFNENSDKGGSLDVANGAHHNHFENINIENVWGAVRFRDWNDNSSHPNDANDAGNNNTFENINVKDVRYGIHFDEFQKLEGMAWDNYFNNCSFENIQNLFQVNRPNSGTRIENSTVTAVERLWHTSSGFDYELNPNTAFINIQWSNVDFDTP